MKVNFSQEEIMIWETQLEEEIKQKLNPCVKRYKDPRKVKVIGLRRSDKYFSYGKESTYVKKKHRREFRSKCKDLMRRGKFENLPNKKVGTQGWETW